jgi:hypothetical protein
MYVHIYSLYIALNKYKILYGKKIWWFLKSSWILLGVKLYYFVKKYTISIKIKYATPDFYFVPLPFNIYTYFNQKTKFYVICFSKYLYTRSFEIPVKPSFLRLVLDFVHAHTNLIGYLVFKNWVWTQVERFLRCIY